MTRPPLRRAAVLLLGLAPLVFVAGCSHNRQRADTQYVARDVSTLYTAAKQRLDRGSYEEAAIIFDEVERQHPYSPWARRAQLMSAFSYYGAKNYTESIQSAQRFLSIHPGNRDAPYAYYLIALCYYEQIGDVTRDQKITLQAHDALGELIRRFPNTRYSADARLKLDLVNDHLAGKEMEVGRFYERRRQWIAAGLRFRKVIENYQTTTHTPEALERLVESYLALGLVEEAKRSAAVLSVNYPGSEWYQRAFDLMQKYQPGAVTIVERPTAAVAPTPPPIAGSQPARVGISQPVATSIALPQDKPAKVKKEKKAKPEKKAEPARCGKGGLFHRARCEPGAVPPPSA
ncbi:MAG TPA: outer membrane protein assembly factor BamD [Sphingobium sp.]